MDACNAMEYQQGRLLSFFLQPPAGRWHTPAPQALLPQHQEEDTAWQARRCRHRQGSNRTLPDGGFPSTEQQSPSPAPWSQVPDTAHIWGRGREDCSPMLHMCSAQIHLWGHAEPDTATWISLSARKAWQASHIRLHSWASSCHHELHICMTRLNSVDLLERCCPYMLQSDPMSWDQGVYLRKYSLLGCLYILQ